MGSVLSDGNDEVSHANPSPDEDKEFGSFDQQNKRFTGRYAWFVLENYFLKRKDE